MNARDKVTVHYTRCPVPTATGIGLAMRMFDALYADTMYRFRDIAELGPESADAHYTHSIDYFFREGGGAPPLWARARGADSRLLGVTFMEELLGIYVRADDAALTVEDLAGRRIGVPVWPSLVFDFWRFAAEKGFHSALARHGLRDTDVERVDVVENSDSNSKRNGRSLEGDSGGLVYGYRRQLEALLARRVDAVFGKGAEAAVLEREAGGRIRLLYDLRGSPDIGDRVNNSTPRLVTTSTRLVSDHPEAVVRYLQGMLRAARWAPRHPEEATNIIARECGIAAPDVLRCFQTNYAGRLVPAITPELMGTVEVMKSFLLERGYLARDFALECWVDAAPLAEALRREDESASLGGAVAPR